MKKIIIIMMTSILIIKENLWANEEIVNNKIEKLNINKASYAIGYNLAKDFQNQEINFDPLEFNQGFNDGITGEKPKLNKKEMKEILTFFQEEMIRKNQTKFKAESMMNEKTSNVLINELRKSGNLKELEPGIFFQFLSKGQGATPKPEDLITVHYTGTLPAKVYSESPVEYGKELKNGELFGEIFDDSKNIGKPVSFSLNQVIPCLSKALREVSVGSEVIIYCDPKSAYGEMAPPIIGPNQVLSFKIKILSIEK